ncbi:MAG TPA: hypothetical protein VN580_10440 [Clostridia bacterium]|nr:hypothetical protein [Clostridia bacterium]
MIFSPNHIFNDYISNVLPELGENNVVQTTLDEYTERLIGQGLRLESFNSHMEYLLHSEAFNPENIRTKGYIFKSSEEFLKAVRLFAIEKSEATGQLCDIYYEGRLAVKGSELERVYRESNGKLPINKRLSSARASASTLSPFLKPASSRLSLVITDVNLMALSCHVPLIFTSAMISSDFIDSISPTTLFLTPASKGLTSLIIAFFYV